MHTDPLLSICPQIVGFGQHWGKLSCFLIGGLWPKFWFEHITTVICTYVVSNLHSVQGRNSIQGLQVSVSGYLFCRSTLLPPWQSKSRLKKEKFQEQIRNQILGLLWWDLKISSSSTMYNHHKIWHRTLGVVLVRSIFILAWFPQSSFVQQWRSSGWHLTQLWWQPSLYKRITFSLQKQGIHKSFHLRVQSTIQARWVLLRGPQT